jgi:hypothetical protein
MTLIHSFGGLSGWKYSTPAAIPTPTPALHHMSRVIFDDTENFSGFSISPGSSLIVRFHTIDHPRGAEAIDEHGKLQRPKGFLNRHFDRSIFC